MIRAAVLGHPIAQSLSPRIYNRWMADAGIEGEYKAFDVPPDYFEKAVRKLQDDGYEGVNVTLPHKGAALSLADEITETAEAVGAANLLRFESGRIIADNTDAYGFSQSILHASGSLDGGLAVVLGAGGAAAAILHALRRFDRIILLNRTRERAEAMAARFANVEVGPWDQREALVRSGAKLLVNTTSLGMAGQPPLDLEFAGEVPGLVTDIVYKPLHTELLQRAKTAGAAIQTGLAMLVYQAVPSFEAYTGEEVPDPLPILRSLEREFA